MGKTTQVDGDNNPTSPESDPAKLLEAALLQMDGIIAGMWQLNYIFNITSYVKSNTFTKISIYVLE